MPSGKTQAEKGKQETATAAPSREQGAIGEHTDGLMLIGTLSGRRRRVVRKEGQPDRYGITFRVRHARGDTNAEFWSDVPAPVGCPVVGERVGLPVEVRVFQTAAGPKYSVMVVTQPTGEEF